MSSVPTIFSAAYSLEILLQNPLLTAILTVAVCTVLNIQYHGLASAAAAMGVVVAGSVRSHFEWPPSEGPMKTISLLSVFVTDLLTIGRGPVWTAVGRIMAVGMDYITFNQEVFVRKTGVYAVIMAVHLIIATVFPQIRELPLDQRIKFDLFIFAVIAGFVTLSCSYILKNKKEDEE